jgi:manganese-dependent ADP-ribose/CDP-alcohol diphosphatase
MIVIFQIVKRIGSLYSRSYATMASPLCADPSLPLLTFGLIADVQYADIDDGASFDRSEERFYRESLLHARRAAESWAVSGATFIVNLGDTIDGANARLPVPKGDEALATVLSTLSPERARLPVFHTLGNHELLNFSRERAKSLLSLPPTAVLGADDTRSMYYHVDPAPGWRLVVLDVYDVAFNSHHESGEPSPQHAAAIDLLRAHNPNPCAWGGGAGNFFAGLQGTGIRNRWVPFNGAVGDGQVAWLKSTLADAGARGLSVLVFSHVLLHDGAARNGSVSSSRTGGDVHKCLAWNFEEVRDVLAAAGGTVAAVFSGHLHDGAFGVDAAGIPHITLESPLTHREGAHAVVRLHADRAELTGYGAVASRTIPKRA